MKKSALVSLALVLLGTAPVHAQVMFPIIDYQGYAWETGGFPASDPGDVFSIALVVDVLDPLFGVDLLNDELTLWVTDLSSTGQVNIGGGFLSINYTGGIIELWLDPSKDHVFGINPPNATAPSTFRNGVLFLGGTFVNFVLFYDTNTGSGSYQGNIVFDSGIALGLVGGISGDAFTFGGVMDDAASAGAVPDGYDLQVDGAVEVEVIVAVEEKSWGAVKELYEP